MNKELLANEIKFKAKELGFQACGISKADFLEEEAPKLDQWLTNNYHGQMAYMANHFDKRLDPRLLVDGAKSVISLTYNYFPETFQSPETDIKISKYAYGVDYHLVIKEKLFDFFHWLKEKVGDINGRVFVDSAPVMDKVWAKKAGLGWQGKNTNLISKQVGSFFFIAELIVDIDLTYDILPMKDYCGTCTKCIDACPTDAIVAPYQIDGSKCISYLTIELKEQIPNSFKNQMEGWVFGCDICQDVCPWNRFSTPTNEKQFSLPESVKSLKSKDFKEMTKEVFNQLFKDSPIKRAKYEGLLNNITFVVT